MFYVLKPVLSRLASVLDAMIGNISRGHLGSACSYYNDLNHFLMHEVDIVSIARQCQYIATALIQQSTNRAIGRFETFI